MSIRWLRAAALSVAVIPIVLLGAGCDTTDGPVPILSSAGSSDEAPQGGAEGPVEPSFTKPATTDPDGGAGGPPEPLPTSGGVNSTTVDVNALCEAAAAVSRTNMLDGWPAPSTQDELNRMVSRLAAYFRTLGYHELSSAFADYATAGVAVLTAYQSSDSATIASARDRLITSARMASEMARSLGFDECAALTLTE